MPRAFFLFCSGTKSEKVYPRAEEPLITLSLATQTEAVHFTFTLLDVRMCRRKTSSITRRNNSVTKWIKNCLISTYLLPSSVLDEYSPSPTSHSLPSQDFSRKHAANSMKSLLIIMFLSIQFFHYMFMFVLSENRSNETLAFSGALFHVLGFPGRVACLMPGCICAQSVLMRILLYARQRNRDLSFLRDIMEFSLLPGKKNTTKFVNRIKVWYKTVKILRTTALIIALFGNIFLFKLAIQKDSSIKLVMFWTFGFVTHATSASIIIVDYFNLLGFWFMSRSYLVMGIEQMLNEMTTSAERRARVRSFINSYRLLEKVLLNFDSVSKYFVFFVATSSSISNAAFLFAGIKCEDPLLSFLFFGCLAGFISTSHLILYAAATVKSRGDEIYKRAYSIIVGIHRKCPLLKDTQRLSFAERMALKDIIETTGSESSTSICCRILGGTPYDSTAFFAYVGSCFSTFIIIYDFLDELL